MGTNYYLHEPARDEPLHIGKSSTGWCFSLHVYPDDETLPQSLEDWKRRWSYPGMKIFDEYGDRIHPKDMSSIVTVRRQRWEDIPLGYISWTDFHRRNYSEFGPDGLLRHRISPGHCVGHGSGTWDLIVGEFS